MSLQQLLQVTYNQVAIAYNPDAPNYMISVYQFMNACVSVCARARMCARMHATTSPPSHKASAQTLASP